MPPSPVDSLILEASVLEDFEDPLDKLAGNLLGIDALAEDVFPIEADVNIASAIAEIETLEQRLDAVDDDINVDAATETTDVDRGATGRTQSLDVDRLDVDTLRPSGGINLREMFSGAERRGELSDLFPEGSLVENLGGEFPSEITATESGVPVLRDVDMEMKRQFFGIDADLDEALGMKGPFGFGEDDGLDNLFKQFKNLQFSARSLNETYAATVPLLATFVGALPAAIAGIISLAGAAVASAGTLASIGAIAALGMGLDDGEFSMEPITNRIAELQSAVVEAFTPVATRLAPLAEGAFDSAESMFRGLAEAASFLVSVTDEVRGVLSFLEGSVPDVAEKIARFGAAALPIFGAINTFLADLNLISGLADVLSQTLPLLFVLGDALAGILPAVIGMSSGFLLVSSGVLELISVFTRFLNLIPFGLEIFGALAGGLLTLVTVTSLYSLATNSALISVLQFASGIVSSALPSLSALIGAEAAATVQTMIFYGAVIALTSALTLGLAGVLSTVGAGFGVLSNDISDATASLKEFGRVSGRLDGTSIGGPSTSMSMGQPRPSTPPRGETTVVAPDAETGNRLANEITFRETSPSNTESRQENN